MDTTDPVELINRLDPDTISARLDQIERERKALMVLLRASRRARRGVKQQEEAVHDQRPAGVASG